MGNKRTYSTNDSFFENLNEKSAYWLGFLYADGYIMKTENCVRITLSSKDKVHLEKFKKDTDSKSPVLFHMNRYSEKYPLKEKARVSITSKKMKEDLIKLGCTTEKTLTCTFPTLREDLISHFIRGYFDGDGCVYLVRPTGRMKSFQIAVSFIGTEGFLSSLRKILGFDESKILGRDKRLSVNIRELSFGGNNIVMKFYDYIYKDATVFLERKREVFESYKQRRSETIIQTS
jgi:hypothetical protein